MDARDGKDESKSSRDERKYHERVPSTRASNGRPPDVPDLMDIDDHDDDDAGPEYGHDIDIDEDDGHDAQQPERGGRRTWCDICGQAGQLGRRLRQGRSLSGDQVTACRQPPCKLLVCEFCAVTTSTVHDRQWKLASVRDPGGPPAALVGWACPACLSSTRWTLAVARYDPRLPAEQGCRTM